MKFKNLLKLILVVMCVTALLFAAACGNNTSKESGETRTAEEQTTGEEISEDEKKEEQQDETGNKEATQDSKENESADTKDNQGNETAKTDDTKKSDSKTDSGNTENKKSDTKENSNTDTKTSETTTGSGISAEDKTSETTGSAVEKEDEKQTIDDIINENEKVEKEFSYNGKSYGFKQNVKTYLIMGIDRYGEVEVKDYHLGTGQCDAMYLLVVDGSAKKYTVLQLDRDAMVQMVVTNKSGEYSAITTQQICLAHAYGDGAEESCTNAVNTVRKYLLGINIDGYSALQFEGIEILNDELGGVEVYIDEDLTAADPSFVKGSTVLLKGETALKYFRVRLGVSDGKNVSRMKRQSTYLTAFKQKFEEEFKKNSKIVDAMYADVKDYNCTNMTLSTIANVAAKLIDYEYGGIVNLEGEHIKNDNTNYMEFYTDEDSLYQTVINLWCTEVK